MPDNNDAGGNNGGGEGSRPVWMDSLPDAHKNNASFMPFKEPAAAWDKFDQLLKAEGSMITIPGEKATDEERKAFLKKLDVPEVPDKYELDDPKLEKHYTKEADKMLREVLHSATVSKKGAKVIHQAFVDMLKGGIAAQQKAEADRAAAEQTALDEAVNTLKDTWKGDTFKANTELSHRGFKRVLGWAGISEEDGKKFLEETKIGNLQIGNHPLMLKLFHAIATKTSDDSMGGGRGGASGEGSDEEKAKARFPNTKFKQT